MNKVEPKDRDIAMVFQSYALYPHMTVYQNMAFSLEMRKESKKLIHERVTEAAQTLQITDYLYNKPSDISGGQRQRVALGRAMVRNPAVFLMDEPLSNLDAKLREHMRVELVRLHQDLGTTTIYVTHDQTEAMTMATRSCCWTRENPAGQCTGKFYNRPENLFVAGFIGSPTMNILRGTMKKADLLSKAALFRSGRKRRIVRMQAYENKPVILGIQASAFCPAKTAITR